MEPGRLKDCAKSLLFRSWRAMAATLLLVCSARQAAFAQARSNPLAGQWRCTASAVRMPAFKQIPAGSLTQHIAYRADDQGRWTSNSVLQYHADKGGGQLRVHSTASGTHRVNGQTVTETIGRFHITPPPDDSSPFAQSIRPTLQAMLVLMMQENRQQHYRLVHMSPQSYVMQPATSTGKSAQRISCQKAR